MPKVSKQIKDVYATVTRPVAFSVLKGVAALCGWDFAKEEVIFRGKAIQPQSLAAGEYAPNSVDNDVKGPGDGFLSIELQEQPEDNAVMYDTTFKRNSLPVFADPKLGVSLVPSYRTMNATLTITKRFQSDVEAERWWYDMYRLISQEHNAAFLEADYSYILPVQMLMLLKEIHTKREAVAGYGDKFSAYLQNGFDKRATTETTVKGVGESKSVRLVVREHQTEINGWFDFGDAPKPQKVEGSSTFDVSFGYRYQYEMPTAIVARYPTQVHQQILDTAYLYKQPIGVRDKRQVRRGGMAVQYQDAMRDQFLPQSQRYDTVFKYPELDEWTPSLRSEVELPSVTLFTGLFSIDPLDPDHVVGFDELAEAAEFHPELRRWFLAHPEWMSTYYQSPIYLQMWKNNTPYRNDEWYIDKHGDVRSVNPMDLRSTYRIRLAVLCDLSRLQDETLREICLFPELTFELLLAVGCPKDQLPKLNARGTINYTDLINVIRILPKTARWFRRRKDRIIPRILIGSIIGVKNGTQ